ncbi:MAG: FAD-binding protein [Alphaproteobacteria bacterium]|nr:FAD-binding protein [Alphaproteobacteria bacterium]
MSVLVIAEHDHQSIKPVTLNVVAAAKKIGGDIHVMVAGTNCSGAAEQAAKISGVSKILKCDAPELSHRLAENMAPLIESLASSYSHIVFPATTFGKNVSPRVAALLDTQQISDVIAVHDADTFDRPVYAGNAIATVKSSDGKKVLTVRGTAFDPIANDDGNAPIEDVASKGDSGLSKFVKQELSESDRPELTAARVVVSGGRGLGSGENFALIDALADKLGAAVGASRAAVDAGYVPNDYQVGQTGKVVAPDLYIAVGISGAIQHLAGMKGAKKIVAINKDPEAPIFQVADYGLVADLFEAVPELTNKL